MAVPPSAGQARLPTHTHVTLALICAPVPAPSLRSPSHLQCRSAVSQMAPPPLKPCSSSPAASTTTPACQLVRGCDRDGGGAMCGAALCRGGVAFFSHSTYRDPPPPPPTHTHTPFTTPRAPPPCPALPAAPYSDYGLVAAMCSALGNVQFAGVGAPADAEPECLQCGYLEHGASTVADALHCRMPAV